MAIAIFVGMILFIVCFLLFTNFRGHGYLTSIVFGFFAVLAPVVYLETSGYAKPMYMEWRDLDGSRVIGAHPAEEEGVIYVWLRTGSSEPRVYTIPWTAPKAELLQNGTNDPRQSRELVFKRTPMGVMTFEKLPQSDLPEKLRR